MAPITGLKPAPAKRHFPEKTPRRTSKTRTSDALPRCQATARTTAILAVIAHGRDAPATAGRMPALRFAGCPRCVSRVARATTCGAPTTRGLSTSCATHTPSLRLSVVSWEKMSPLAPTLRNGCPPTEEEPGGRDNLAFVSGQSVALQDGGGTWRATSHLAKLRGCLGIVGVSTIKFWVSALSNHVNWEIGQKEPRTPKSGVRATVAAHCLLPAGQKTTEPVIPAATIPL
jgi:hypothetical protein